MVVYMKRSITYAIKSVGIDGIVVRYTLSGSPDGRSGLVQFALGVGCAGTRSTQQTLRSKKRGRRFWGCLVGGIAGFLLAELCRHGLICLVPRNRSPMASRLEDTSCLKFTTYALSALVSVLLLLVISLILVALGWSARTARLGTVWGLMIAAGAGGTFLGVHGRNGLADSTVGKSGGRKHDRIRQIYC